MYFISLYISSFINTINTRVIKNFEIIVILNRFKFFKKDKSSKKISSSKKRIKIVFYNINKKIDKAYRNKIDRFILEILSRTRSILLSLNAFDSEIEIEIEISIKERLLSSFSYKILERKIIYLKRRIYELRRFRKSRSRSYYNRYKLINFEKELDERVSFL